MLRNITNSSCLFLIIWILFYWLQIITSFNFYNFTKQSVLVIHFCITNYTKAYIYYFIVSVTYEFVNSSTELYWLRISHEVSVKCHSRLQVSESLTGRSTFKMEEWMIQQKLQYLLWLSNGSDTMSLTLTSYRLRCYELAPFSVGGDCTRMWLLGSRDHLEIG